MKEALELRKKTDELEKSVKELVDNFIAEVGICDVKIEVDSQFLVESGKRYLVNNGVKIYVTV